MGSLKQYRKSKLGAQTDKNPAITSYQKTVLNEYSVRFTPTLAGGGYQGYVKIEGSSYGAPIAPPPPPPPVPELLLAENGDFLMTENNNNLIT